MDLVLLVDGSGSINAQQFPQVKEFLKEIVAEFQVGPSQTRIALVQFSGRTQQKVEFGLAQYTDDTNMINAIDAMQQQR